MLTVYQPQTKIEWFVHVLLAWDVEARQEPHVDAGERITLKLEPFDKVKQRALAREGHLGELAGIFESASRVKDLLVLPEFKGRLILR